MKYCAWKTKIYGQHSSHKQSDCTLWKNYLVMTGGRLPWRPPHPCGPSMLPTWNWAVRYPVDVWSQRQGCLAAPFPAGDLWEHGRHVCECGLATGPFCHVQSHGGASDVTPGGAGPAPLHRTPPPQGRLWESPGPQKTQLETDQTLQSLPRGPVSHPLPAAFGKIYLQSVSVRAGPALHARFIPAGPLPEVCTWNYFRAGFQ